jgi:hypothetical protein
MAKLRPLLGVQLDRIFILVDIAVMQTTEQEAIVQAGVATVGPVLDMVTLKEK